MITILLSQVIIYSYEKFANVEPDVVVLKFSLRKAGFPDESKAKSFVEGIRRFLNENTYGFEEEELRIQPIFVRDETTGKKVSIGTFVSMVVSAVFKNEDELGKFKSKLNELSSEQEFETEYINSDRKVSDSAYLKVKFKLMKDMMDDLNKQLNEFGNCNLKKVEFEDVILPPDEKNKIGLKAYVTIECSDETAKGE